MTEFNNHTDDTPPNWERYAEMLRRQPEPSMPKEHVAGMMPRIDAGIAAHARRNQIVRWVAAPVVSVAMVITIVLLQLSSIHQASQNVRPAGPEVASVNKEQRRPVRRPVHRRVAPVPAPIEEAPAVADTPVERVPTPEIAHEEEVGPGPGFAHPTDAQATPRP